MHRITLNGVIIDAGGIVHGIPISGTLNNILPACHAPGSADPAGLMLHDPVSGTAMKEPVAAGGGLFLCQAYNGKCSVSQILRRSVVDPQGVFTDNIEDFVRSDTVKGQGVLTGHIRGKGRARGIEAVRAFIYSPVAAGEKIGIIDTGQNRKRQVLQIIR